MTPSQKCKEAGLKSLAELVRTLMEEDTERERVRVEQTLINWHRDKPKLFSIVVAGAVALKGQPAP